MTVGRFRLVAALILLAAGIMLTGCGSDDEFDPHDPAIEQARQKTAGEVSSAVQAALTGLSVHAVARRDACQKGQHILSVQDPYRWRCGAGYAAAAGISAAGPHEAVQAAQTALANCVGAALASDAKGVAGLATSAGASPGPSGHYRCNRHQVDVQLLRSDDQRLSSILNGLPYGPFGLSLIEETLDIVAAAADARAHGQNYLMIAHASHDYYWLPAQQ